MEDSGVDVGELLRTAPGALGCGCEARQSLTRGNPSADGTGRWFSTGVTGAARSFFRVVPFPSHLGLQSMKHFNASTEIPIGILRPDSVSLLSVYLDGLKSRDELYNQVFEDIHNKLLNCS